MSVRLDITAEVLRSLGYRELHAGDDYDMQFTATRDGAAVDLTSAAMWLTIKDDPIVPDSQAKLQLTQADRINITDPTNGIFVVEFRQADTEDLEGKHQYDIQIKLAVGTIITHARGKIEFLPNLTRSVS